uniref:Tetratricopeptide repeat protein 37 n=1 Tax=Anthurium amnicola TaxID=1678845 RepID=A0A1D1Y0Z0_9ARAE
MALGSLILEGENSGFWVAFGCLSHNNALKQHALIRGLHLDISLSVAWAYLGKFYRRSGNLELAKQAFDRARSIDPSLALPWAGMSVGSARESLSDEAYESCLRAVQMLPLPEFQIGLGKLAALSGHLLSPQVFGAIQQAVQRAPYYPESHNLKGLVCEARSDYCSAIAAYRNAQYALNFFCKSAPKSQVADISLNLARSLCQAGHASDAEQVCEELKREGFLDNIGQQLYVIALWQQGKKESFLTEAAYLARNIPEMDRSCGAAALGLVCRLVYCSLGQDHATRTILKSPRDLLQNAKMSFVVAALCALDSSCPLHSLLSCDLQSFLSDEAAEMHYVTAVSKMLANQSHVNMGIKFAQHHLRKALHMYPDSGLMRKQLSSLLLCSKDWMASHIATRCVSTAGRHSVMKASNSGYEILGAATVACYGNCMGKHKLSFPTCKSQFVPVGKRIHQLQKWFREEPWNCKARYLLILSVLQKAREEKFPKHLCVSLKRLVSSALSDDVYLVENQVYVYQKFQLLLCASEIHLQSGDYLACISQAIEASRVPLYNDGRFFAHLQLCRGYAIIEDWQNLRNEYMKCIQHGTFYEIGWISLKLIESRYTLLTNVCSIDSNLETCLKENEESQHMWAAVFDLVCCQSFLWNRDFLHAEAALAHACSMERVDSCLLLCHGAVCMELARQQGGSHFLLLAIDSLTKAQGSSPIPLPIVSALLAQAVGSLGAKDQWKKNLQSEWFSWPAEMRPAELYFQMHLLTRRSNVGSKRYSGVESSQSPERWVLESIHINPSSLRYWKVLQKLMES